MNNKHKIFTILSILISPFTIWLFISGHWGWGMITSCLLIFNFLNLFQSLKSLNSKNKPSSINNESTVNCPNCKNPNTQNLRICEWCGNQIL